MAPGAPVTPVPLMQIATGFWAFKTLAAAHELDLFTRLAGGAETTAQELAGELGIEQRPAEMLLTGCASLGLLERGQHGYRNTALSERFLVRGTPYYFGGLVTMFDRRLYPGWAKLTEAIRTNRPTTWDPERERSMFEREDPAVLETFWEAMHSLSGFTARTLGDAIDLDAATRLLDVGGGSGAFAIELCRRYPSLNATVFDLPHVIDIAADRIADAELRDRIAVHGGDFFADALPPGHDVHVYSMIMHDWNQERDRLLLRKSFDALPSSGMDHHQRAARGRRQERACTGRAHEPEHADRDRGPQLHRSRVHRLAEGRRLRRAPHRPVRRRRCQRRRHRTQALTSDVTTQVPAAERTRARRARRAW